MSQLSVGSSHSGDHSGHGAHAEPQVAARAALKPELVRANPGQFAMLAYALMLVGVLALILTGVIGYGDREAARQAIGAYHIGFVYCVTVALGALGFQMILQQFNAGWSAAPRRQAENIASLVWVCLLLFIPVAANALIGTEESRLFKWMSPEHVAGDLLYQKKAAWLNVDFWLVRAAVYFFIWITLALTLSRLSLKQDATGDRWLTARARFISSFGLLLFALSAAFASFDWLMGLDHHWFSTMFGVTFFAGAVVASTSTIIIILALFVNSGKLKGLVTSEHFHDLGKVLFAFTVFWAYVNFSQYFLIWYSNIPEETAFYNLRQMGNWREVGIFLAVGHFIVPFLIVLFRFVKRSPRLLMLVGLWMLFMHAIDLYYMVRPVIKTVPLGERLHLDIIGIAGPVLLMMGLILRRVAAHPLIPLKDPRLHEAIEHKNYV